MTIDKKSGEVLTVGIVGGGRGGHAMMDIFGNSSQCTVKYIVDRSAAAPAFSRARKIGIKTSTEVRGMVENTYVDLVVEATGLAAVLEDVKKWAGDHSLVLSSRIALLIFK